VGADARYGIGGSDQIAESLLRLQTVMRALRLIALDIDTQRRP
jgi:hypothetical protein